MSDELPARPRAFGTIVYGGLAAGVLDFLYANIYFGLWNGAPLKRIWQGVASGLIGRELAVINGSWKTAVLGVFLHFVIAFIIATVFYIGCLVLPGLIRHPIIWGLLYGVVCWCVMSWIVVPNSRVSPGAAAVVFSLGPIVVKAISWTGLLHGTIGHAILIGLPVALCARRSAKAG